VNRTHLPDKPYDLINHFWANGAETREIVWKNTNGTNAANSTNQNPLFGFRPESEFGRGIEKGVEEASNAIRDFGKLPWTVVLIIFVAILIVTTLALIVICLKVKQRRRKGLVTIQQHFHGKDSPSVTENLLKLSSNQNSGTGQPSLSIK